MLELYRILAFCLFISIASISTAENLNPVIYDAHIHYDGDVWPSLTASEAIDALSEVGIAHAVVSATPTEGAEYLYKAAPGMIIPFLRPYKSLRHRYLWFKDPTTPDFIREHLKRAPYRGIGEFHVFGKDTETDIVKQVLKLARENQLAIHSHTDQPGILTLLESAPDIPVIWAHGGFDASIVLLRQLLEKHDNFYVELSLREGMLDNNDKLTREWANLLTVHSDRFLTGMDTYKPSRWADLPEIAKETRHWLNQLPEDTAANIARNNVARLFQITNN
jgi:hypothetical protein